MKEGSDEPQQCVDLDELVHSVVQRHLRLGRCVKVQPGVRAPVSVRPMAMQRLLANLLDNGFKHGRTPQAPAEVMVQTWQQGSSIYLSVLDRGPGIPESETLRVLQPFERLESARSNLTGSGLGLAIVDRIARMHGRHLQLLARAGGGLEARIEWPIAPRQ